MHRIGVSCRECICYMAMPGIEELAAGSGGEKIVLDAIKVAGRRCMIIGGAAGSNGRKMSRKDPVNIQSNAKNPNIFAHLLFRPRDPIRSV